MLSAITTVSTEAHASTLPPVRCSIGAMQTQLAISTHGPGLTEITREVADWLARTGARDGLVTLIQENADPEVQADLTAFFHRLVPPSDDPAMAYLTHTYEGPDDMPGHIKAALLPVSLQIPVAEGRMALGTWQGIYVVEHRTRPHQRHVALHFRVD